MEGARLPWDGSARNGLPESAGGYAHPGWVGGQPSAADNPTHDGICRGCHMPVSSRVHKARCLGQLDGPPPGEDCGTAEGYRRHLNAGEVADDWCLAAWALRSRQQRAAHDPRACQACGYKLGSKRCAAACGPGAGVPLAAAGVRPAPLKH